MFVIKTGGQESFKDQVSSAAAFLTVCRSSKGRLFTFRDLDSLNLYGLEAAGAPRYTESSIFIIRSRPLFCGLSVEIRLPG